ncbi:MAG: cytochrome c oxidase assembly protein [Pseudomonadota bacterium]|nr:cytochrome c oxidase assembly protein [Pseudomonadota bacterium]
MTWSQLLLPWEFSALLCLATALAAMCYYHHRFAATRRQQAAFWLGLALVYVVSHTGFEYYAEHEFFMHRLQHLVLHHLGPFLLVLGLPRALVACTWAPCRRLRSGRLGTLLWRCMSVLCHPVLSALLFNALVVFWLIPAVHFPAMLDWRLYRVMNLSMLINGLLFWAAVLRGLAPGREDLGVSRRVLLMIAVVPAQIVIGALIFFAPRDLYPVYALCGRAFDGLTALQDQQIGGLILWIPGSMMSVAGIVIVLQRRLRQRDA